MAYRDTVLALNPSLYWRLGESAGTNANDETANNRDGTYTGTITKGVAGAIGGDADTAVDCAGTLGAYITSTYNPFTQNASRTYAGWASRDTTSTTDTIFSGSDAISNPVFQVDSSRTVTFWGSDSSTGVSWSTGWPNDTSYHQWALAYNDATLQASYYLDGSLVSTLTEPTFGYWTSPGNFEIAGSRNTGANPWDGKMDEIVLFERLLVAGEVSALFTGTPYVPSSNPITGIISSLRR